MCEFKWCTHSHSEGGDYGAPTNNIGTLLAGFQADFKKQYGHFMSYENADGHNWWAQQCVNFCELPGTNRIRLGKHWAVTGQTGFSPADRQWAPRVHVRPANTPGLTKNSLSWCPLCTPAASYVSLASAWARSRPVKKGHCRTEGPILSCHI